MEQLSRTRVILLSPTSSRLIASAVMTPYFIFYAKLYILDLFIENSVILADAFEWLFCHGYVYRFTQHLQIRSHNYNNKQNHHLPLNHIFYIPS